MIPNRIQKVLSSIATHRVQCLLMGGQACVLYGAAEFSRDADFAIVADADNLGRLQRALDELQAHPIAVPPFDAQYLAMGLAVHFRCRHPEADRVRVDVMSRMRGVDPFLDLWERRTMADLGDVSANLMSLPDLVRAKKTQRAKDWPMIQRLVEVSYFQHRLEQTPELLDFWFRELRTPDLLVELAHAHPQACSDASGGRPLLGHAAAGDLQILRDALHDEMCIEQEADRAYWAPLRQTLSELRRSAR